MSSNGIYIQRPVYHKLCSSSIFQILYFNTDTREFILKDAFSTRMHVRKSALDATKMAFDKHATIWEYDKDVVDYLLSIGIDHIDHIPAESLI